MVVFSFIFLLIRYPCERVCVSVESWALRATGAFVVVAVAVADVPRPFRWPKFAFRASQPTNQILSIHQSCMQSLNARLVEWSLFLLLPGLPHRLRIRRNSLDRLSLSLSLFFAATCSCGENCINKINSNYLFIFYIRTYILIIEYQYF